MNDVQTVIFLGAGASASEGAPIQSTIFREYFTRYRDKSIYAASHEWDRELATFFHQFFGIDIDHDVLHGVIFPTFEEILGVLEIAESQEESFRDWPGAHIIKEGTSRIRHIHDLLVFLIGETLHETLRMPKDIHRMLIREIDRLGDLEDTAFVSFNYDILIDNAMLEHLGDGNTDYGTDFVNQNRPRLDPHSKAVPLFKLHGSLNWLSCPTCRNLHITPHEKGVMRIKWEPEQTVCEQCGTPRSPIVIPPTFFKVMANLALRQIWNVAEQACMTAKRLVFCGYSFPDADVHVRYLLKRSELNGQRTPEVFIVNHHDGKSAETSESEANRYARFFVNKANIHYTDISFEEFAANPRIIEDKARWK